jgi:hypothetical protein
MAASALSEARARADRRDIEWLATSWSHTRAVSSSDSVGVGRATEVFWWYSFLATVIPERAGMVSVDSVNVSLDPTNHGAVGPPNALQRILHE